MHAFKIKKDAIVYLFVKMHTSSLPILSFVVCYTVKIIYESDKTKYKLLKILNSKYFFIKIFLIIIQVSEILLQIYKICTIFYR